jgi:hypothetical protein
MTNWTRMRAIGATALLVAFLATCTSAEAEAADETKPKKPNKKKKEKVAPTPAPVKIASSTKSPTTPGLLAPGAKLDASQLAAHIDDVLNKRLAKEKVPASPRTTDEEFLRRVYLDITGQIPTSDQAIAFLDSKDENKRSKLVDDLLASKQFGERMADIWQSLLVERNSDNRRLAQYMPNLRKWLTEQFNANKPWDKMVHEILTASGDVNENGAAVFFLANPSADKMTDTTTRMFLGVQLQCAQCHNHPFTDYKQDEYWGMAAFFMKTRAQGNVKAAAKENKGIVISESAAAKGKKAGLPESAKILPPKFLQDASPKIANDAPYRPVLANWVTNKTNPFFARAMANRLWGQYFGRGIVNPVDDMHDANPATHPELLSDLASQFAAHDFDIKYLVRAIVLSEAYQRTSRPVNNGDIEPEMYARMAVKPLSPEQLFDSMTKVIGTPAKGGEKVKNKATAPKGGQASARDQFVAFFGIEDGADPTEYAAGIPQVLRLMNSPQFNTTASVARITAGSKTPAESIEKLYLTVLSRRPSKEETERITRYLKESKDPPRETLSGVLWALLNSSEFALNR